MRFTIISKNYGTQSIDTEKFNPQLASTESTIFKVVEHIFNEWFDHNTQPGAPLGKDIEGMYYGECDQPPIYSKKGAIRQGIENVIEHLIDTGKEYCKLTTRDLQKIDVEAAFL